MLFQAYFLLIASLISTVAAKIKPVEVKGNAFFLKDSDERFYMRGLDYQPGGSSDLTDPIGDPDVCKRDIPYFKDLGINTIRIYSIDNTNDHSECMNALADAGIYVIFDTNTPHASITRGNNSECSYNYAYLEQVFASILKVAEFDNTLGFFAANEVINDKESTHAATQVKATVRDMKTFMKNRGLRNIPVGYSAADVEENRVQTARYFNCGDDEMARVDMFGFNDYSWCGDSSYKVSGYDEKVDVFSNYSIPIFFSEYGCNEVKDDRPFTEVEAIYSEKMTKVFSGGLVYEYSEEDNNYGLAKIDGDDVETNDDFKNLKDQFEKVKNPSGDGDYQEDLDHSSCPAKSDMWDADNKLPPTPKGALKFIIADAEPEGNGFDAYTQQACDDPKNDVDDSDDYSSLSGASHPTSTSSSSSSTGGSSSSNDDDDDDSDSSSSAEDSAVVAQISSFTALVAVIGYFFY